MRQEADATRTLAIEALGYRVLRFTNADVLGNVEAVALALQTAFVAERLKAHP